jgi:hypothetical protein
VFSSGELKKKMGGTKSQGLEDLRKCSTSHLILTAGRILVLASRLIKQTFAGNLADIRDAWKPICLRYRSGHPRLALSFNPIEATKDIPRQRGHRVRRFCWKRTQSASSSLGRRATSWRAAIRFMKLDLAFACGEQRREPKLMALTFGQSRQRERLPTKAKTVSLRWS